LYNNSAFRPRFLIVKFAGWISWIQEVLTSLLYALHILQWLLKYLNLVRQLWLTSRILKGIPATHWGSSQEALDWKHSRGSKLEGFAGVGWQGTVGGSGCVSAGVNHKYQVPLTYTYMHTFTQTHFHFCTCFLSWKMWRTVVDLLKFLLKITNAQNRCGRTSAQSTQCGRAVPRREKADGWRSSVAKAKVRVLWCWGLR
jgi:hypothetical protein